jgi:AraC-like DNA-binding protein
MQNHKKIERVTKMKNLNTYHKLSILDGVQLLNAQHNTVNFPFHTHDTFNIALILDQTFYTKLNDKFLQAPTGTLSITNPQEVHATPCDKKIGNSFFTFYISPDVFKSLNHNQDVFFEDKIVYDDSLFKELYFLSMNYQNKSFDFEKRLVNAMNLLIKNYATSFKFKNHQQRLFERFLEEESFNKFSLEKTALSFGLDKYKFLRLFKQETGLTPNNYIILKRIENSKKLLETDADLLDIAIEAGFYDVPHFCKKFKEFTGVTPTVYKLK